MSGSEGNGGPNPRVPLGLSLEQTRELGKGNAIHQLQQNYQALSAEVTQLTTGLKQVLNHLKEDPGGGNGRRSPLFPQTDLHSVRSSSSHEDEPPRRERRPPSHRWMTWGTSSSTLWSLRETWTQKSFLNGCNPLRDSLRSRDTWMIRLLRLS